MSPILPPVANSMGILFGSKMRKVYETTPEQRKAKEQYAEKIEKAQSEIAGYECGTFNLSLECHFSKNTQKQHQLLGQILGANSSEMTKKVTKSEYTKAWIEKKKWIYWNQPEVQGTTKPLNQKLNQALKELDSPKPNTQTIEEFLSEYNDYVSKFESQQEMAHREFDKIHRESGDQTNNGESKLSLKQVIEWQKKNIGLPPSPEISEKPITDK